MESMCELDIPSDELNFDKHTTPGDFGKSQDFWERIGIGINSYLYQPIHEEEEKDNQHVLCCQIPQPQSHTPDLVGSTHP